MGVARIDLADAASPERLVLEILKHEPQLPIPVPIELLCSQLDILEIQPLGTPGFEGALLTTLDKHSGIILFNQASRPRRRRFTIAHELCHFLAPSHVPDAQGRFLCTAADMLLLATDERDRRRRMEAEANRFASLILLPPPIFRKDAGRPRDPSMQHVLELSQRYEVSIEAVGRSYVSYRDDLVAIVITKDGILQRAYRDSRRFPFITIPPDAPVPAHSLLRRTSHRRGEPSKVDETDAGIWIDVERGRRAPTLYEQVYLQADGFATIMLSLEQPTSEDFDPDAEKTAKERYRDRLQRN